ncbi:hypothetical protein [Isoptericola sp. NPDC056578]|uniref:hypothetical protein n=1 Tax=unclassified Isoptericola TaxID=2623355 RepID=UPI003673E5FE
MSPDASALLMAAAATQPAPTPWYLSQPVGVVLGALVAGLVSYLVAARAARTARDLADAQRAFDRNEARRSTRKAAWVAFVAAVRTAHRGSKRVESEHGVRYGDMYPEETELNQQVEEALIDFEVEVPDDVVVLAVRLRNQLMRHVWAWDPSEEQDGYASDDDVNAAELELRRAVRTMLAND